MLEADTPRHHEAFWTSARRAWAIILTGFLIFCLIVGSASMSVMRIVRTPIHPPLQVRVAQTESVLIRPAGLMQSNPVDTSDVLHVGDSVITEGKAGPGIAGVIQLYPGTIALWGNTQLNLAQRHVATQPTILKLRQGQIMVDVPTADEVLQVETVEGVIRLAAPGQYRIRRLAEDAQTTALSERNSVPDTEVAVGAGEAIVGDSHIPAGARQLLRKGIRGFGPNAWPLLRDGHFHQFTEEEYNRTMVDDPLLARADTWQVTVQSPVSAVPNSLPGHFQLDQDCPAGNTDAASCRTFAHFVRKGGNDQDSITAITQNVAADVVPYSKVLLTAGIRINMQSLSKTGVLGTECPVLLRVFYTNAENSDQHESDYCFWAFEDPGQKSTESSYPWIRTIHIAPEMWYNFTVDLKQQIPNLLSIQKVEVHANGHDYDTSVRDVSLDGIDLANQTVTPGRLPSGSGTDPGQGPRQ